MYNSPGLRLEIVINLFVVLIVIIDSDVWLYDRLYPVIGPFCSKQRTSSHSKTTNVDLILVGRNDKGEPVGAMATENIIIY